MSDYLLPCSCGERLRVSTSQAGQTVRCACGATLEVPTLRLLRELEQVEESSVARPRWGDRQRIVFVLAVLTFGALATAGYLALQLPPDPARPTAVDVDEHSPIDAAYVAYEDLKKGLDPPAPAVTEEDRRTLEKREQMLWGIKIALALAACSVAVVALGLLSGGRKKR